MDDDLRADLEAAFEADEQLETPSETPADPAPTPSGEVSDPAPGVDAPAPAPEAGPAPADTPADPAAATEIPPAPPAPTPEDRAPGSWKPAMREKWSGVDPEIKAEIWRREREISRAQTQTAEVRKFAQEFEQTVQPFMGFIAAENSTPLAAVQNLMQTAATLRVGTPQQKVGLVADIIKNFGIDLQALDSVLAGQSPQFNPQVAIQEQVQRAIAPLLQQQQLFQQHQQQLEAQQSTAITSELQDFADKNEFYWDVKDTMADLMEVASRRGIEMDLTAAYERAIMMTEPVRRVVEARKQAQAAQQATARARQARGAAVSVTPSAEASAAQPVPGDDLRSAIEFAIAQNEGR